jgi:hypothetical protein
LTALPEEYVPAAVMILGVGLSLKPLNLRCARHSVGLEMSEQLWMACLTTIRRYHVKLATPVG